MIKIPMTQQQTFIKFSVFLPFDLVWVIWARIFTRGGIAAVDFFLDCLYES